MVSEAVIFALDLGTPTGWALRSADVQTISGAQNFEPGRFECGGKRYLRSLGRLAEMLVITGGISAVFVAKVRRHAGVDAAHTYGGFLVTLTACWAGPARGVP